MSEAQYLYEVWEDPVQPVKKRSLQVKTTVSWEKEIIQHFSDAAIQGILDGSSWYWDNNTHRAAWEIKNERALAAWLLEVQDVLELPSPPAGKFFK